MAQFLLNIDSIISSGHTKGPTILIWEHWDHYWANCKQKHHLVQFARGSSSSWEKWCSWYYVWGPWYNNNWGWLKGKNRLRRNEIHFRFKRLAGVFFGRLSRPVHASGSPENWVFAFSNWVFVFLNWVFPFSNWVFTKISWENFWIELWIVENDDLFKEKSICGHS